ncbi:MAG TPA: hypothetical protein VIH99_11085 [Bdellovibrionota bacterium]|jgi:hypothetical protein
MKLFLLIVAACFLLPAAGFAEEESKGKCIAKGRASFDTKCFSKDFQKDEKTCLSGKDGTSCAWDAKRPEENKGEDGSEPPPQGNGGASGR